jgi:hypothetical protein
MRTIVFILFILSVFTTSTFSQEKLLLNLETTGIDVSTYTDFGKYYQESRQQPVTVLTLPELNQSSKENIRGSRSNLNPLDILENNCSYDDLPCVKPALTDAMPVAKPDTTILYTLKGKKMK